MAELETPPLKLLAEIDALLGEVQRWRDQLPDWPASRYVRAAVDRLTARIDAVRIRCEAPLIVATLGGTGTGKSSLVNALVGQVVTTPGKQRPTTRKPVLVCRPNLSPTLLGIDPAAVETVHVDAPALRDLVLLDCPDPDTAEDVDAPQSNTARLRALLPHCDVLLVTGTQQKYRNARVTDELAAAAPGARLVFVQTHADVNDDVREDWRQHLTDDYTPGQMFFVDSVAALNDAQAGIAPRGEFGRLVDHLQRELSGSAAHRIRRANVLDLLDETLAACQTRMNDGLPQLTQIEQAIAEQRGKLAAKLASQMNEELLVTRRSWETRLLGEVTGRWGLSPFALVLRAYHGVGGLVSGAALWRVRTTAQLALWGALEGARRLRSHSEDRTADDAGVRAVAGSWEESELRTAAIIVEGYAHDAGLDTSRNMMRELTREATEAGVQFVTRASGELQDVVQRVAARQSGWFVRLWYETWLVALLGLLVYRLGKNFFYDSWLAYEFGWIADPKPLLGLDFFVAAGFLILLWCGLLVTLFTRRLRRGLRAEIAELTTSWTQPTSAGALFVELEQRIRAIRRSHEDLERLGGETRRLQGDLAATGSQLGRKERLGA
ncbi:MAG: GTPase domain-containing protein [Planctomycetaceae bacterium]|nr:GTPase domain-containing protein [Planctomycetaceae bacterium]